METVNIDAHHTPFPHLIIRDFYNQEELDLIWEELKFYTKPGKLLSAKDYLGVVDRTNAKALFLDHVYRNNDEGLNYRNISNILTVNRKVFNPDILGILEKLHPCCVNASRTTWDLSLIHI